MSTAIFPLTFASEELYLLTAIVLGFLFGFSLERAGFGNARKLAAQFYLYDMTVFKVMFTAIIVAFLGRLHPIGILLAGLLMALTYIGGEIAQSNLQLPSAAIQVFQGMLLFFLLAFDLLTNYRLRFGRTEAA